MSLEEVTAVEDSILRPSVLPPKGAFVFIAGIALWRGTG